ncbi:thiamine diphosphate-binding protein [Nemania serpens]|nr:thiamine diphosphate-binding protein [Nemania serpens]
MLRSRQATMAPQRPFTASSAVSAVRTTTKAPSAIRNQTTAAQSTPQARDIPSPAFNSVDAKDRSHVQPLINSGAPEMDESFVGKTGGEILHEMMLRHGVKHIFGYPGGAILPHEQGAGHMAEGHARACGKPGFVLVTSGPGATNVITLAFQEADVIGISRASTKWNVMAFEIATSGRPGPVLVDLPKDVTASVLRKSIPTTSVLPGLPSAASCSIMDATQKQLQNSLSRVADLINIAKRPVIYAGQGIITSENGPQLLKEFADKASIPVTTTLHGLGAFDELDEKALYIIGMHGSAFANMAMQEADLIIALGSRFDDHVTLNIFKFAPAAKAAAAEGRGGIVHFETMPKNINKVGQATEAIEGDVGQNLAQLLPSVNITTMGDRKEWFDKIKSWKEKWPISDFERTERPGMIKPQALIEQLSNLNANRKHRRLSQLRWRHPRTMITSGGLGTMGYGLPAAIGAKVARPDALFNIGVKVIVLNNKEQVMDRYAHTHQKNPDFMKLADAMGVQHRRLIKPEDTQDCLKWLIELDGPALLEVITDKKVPVLPMVPTGASLHEFLVWDGEKDKKRRELMRSRTDGLHG